MKKDERKTGKPKQNGPENRYFFGALLTVGGLLIIGIAFTFLFGGSNSGGGTKDAGGSEMLKQMENEYGQKWRELGFTKWTSNPEMTMLYVDSASWYKLPVEDQKKRINTAGKDVEDLIKKNGGQAKDVYIMIHDETERMPATYTGGVGAEIQQ